MAMNEDLRNDTRNSISNLYSTIQEILVDVDYSYDRIDSIDSEFDQILSALKKTDQYNHIDFILAGKKTFKS